MFKQAQKALYGVSRTTGRIASTLTDIDVFTSMNPKRIKRRIKRKALYKTTNGLINKIIK